MSFRMHLKLLQIFILSCVLASCGNYDELKEQINDHFPAIDFEDQEKEILLTNANSLERLTTPSILVEIKTSKIQEILNDIDLSSEGIKSTAISTVPNFIVAEFEFAVDSDVQTNWIPTDHVLANTEFSIGGTATVYLGLTGSESSIEGGKSFVTLNLVPRANSIAIDTLRVKGSPDISMLTVPLTAAFEAFNNRINGRIVNDINAEFSVPAYFSGSFNPSSELKRISDNSVARLSGSNEEIRASAEISEIASLIDIDGLALLIGITVFSAENDPVEIFGDVETPTFAEYKESFSALVDNAFGDEGANQDISIVINKSLVSFTLNEALRDTKFCLSARTPIQKSAFSEKISIPGKETINCQSDRNCNIQRDCSNIRRSHDRRNCRACLLRRPWDGGCVQRGNDPICEASKAAQNAVYEADYNARVFDCNRIRESKRAACLVEKSAEKLACETARETLGAISRTGNFANLEGSVDGEANVDACLLGLKFSDDLNRLNANLLVGGSGKVNAALKFTPLDIVGHLTCQAPFTESRTLDVKIKQGLVSVNAVASNSSFEKDLLLSYKIEPSEFDINIDPGPTELLLTSVNSTLACQGANLLKPILVNITPFVPELQGRFQYKPDPIEHTQRIELPSLELNGKKVPLRMSNGEKGLFLYAIY